MSKLIKIDTEYQQWIKNLSERYRQSQLKAAVKVNTEMLRFYWSLGADIVNLKAESKWGDGIIQSISQDLQKSLPGVKGFSITNINYIKRFYLLYSQSDKLCPQLEGNLKGTENTICPSLGVNCLLSLGDITNASSTNALMIQ